MKEKKKIAFPDGIAIVMMMVVFVWLLSFIIPSGAYDRIADAATGRKIVDAASFHFVEKEYLGIMDLLTALHNGFVGAADINFLMFLVGGAFSVARKIGILDKFIKKTAYKLRNHQVLVIPLMMLLISLIDNFIGTPEICMIFIPVFMPLFLSLGFDTMTACGAVLISEMIGFTVSFANPFTVIVGQKLAGLPLYSGFGFRFAAWAVTMAFAIAFVMRYAKKVQADPTKSLVYGDPIPGNVGQIEIEDATFTKRQLWAGISFVGIFAVMLVCVIFFNMVNIEQMNAFFLLLCIIPGVVAGLSSKELVGAIVDGCRSVMYGALIVSAARGISVILSASGIMDTVVYYLASAVGKLPTMLAVIGMQLVQSVFNIFIPSGSGQAIVTLPILLPISDIMGITNQTAIFAFQYGDGLANIIAPNSGILFACLALGGITYGKWLKFFGKFFIFLNLLSFVTLMIAQLIQWGPF